MLKKHNVVLKDWDYKKRLLPLFFKIMNKILKKVLITAGSILGVAVLVVGGYVSYVLLQYNRIEDNKVLNPNNNNDNLLNGDKTYKISTYNIGFGAYRPDYSFFMDEGYMADGTKVSGKYGTAKSKESVIESTEGVINEIEKLDVDFAFYQEVDTNSTRSHHVNQSEMITSSFIDYNNVFAVNYHSAFLMYPFNDPIGKSNSGILTLSKYKIEESIRKSYPVSKGFDRLFDLDRCFSVSRLKVNDKELVLANSHMSAYDEGGKIRALQMQVMKTFFEEEISKGNYVIFGGDFNHDLINENPAYQYNESNPKPSWMNFTQLKPDWLANFDYEADLGPNMSVATSDNAPTCRDCDLPLIGNEDVLYKSVVDGFIVSSNIEIIETKTIVNNFEYSDHQPVLMEFKLK